MKSLIIIDDHEMIRCGIQYWLESKTDWKIIGSCSSIAECKSLLNEVSPSIALIDVDLDNESGFDLIPYIKENFPQIKIVMYSMHEESGYLVKAEKLGANGYISKAAQTEEFEKGLNAVYQGKNYIEQRFENSRDKLIEVSAILSKREFSVFTEMINGKSNEEIAKDLNMKKHSIEVYATQIYEKTFCQNRTELLEKYK